MNNPTNNPGRTPCPPWCTSTHKHSHHEGVLFETHTMTGATTVILDGSETRPLTLSVWDQTETPYRALDLDQADALILARVLAALDPSDLIRFAAALAEGARVLDEQGAEVEL